MKHVLAVIVFSLLTSPVAGSRADANEGVLKEAVAGGRHLRFETDHGAVHVFWPNGYARDSAGILIYIHGYFTDVDKAWSEHRLAEQFAASRQNALFIVPEAPSGKQEDVFWKDIGALLESVERIGNVVRPKGPVVVLGHSGAYRTLGEWLKFRRVDEIILLDAFYGFEDELHGWVETVSGHEANKLVIVSMETTKRSDAFVEKSPFAAQAKEIPDRISRLTRSNRNAQVIYLRSQYSHMELVTSGKVIPELLRLTPFQRLPN